MQEKIDTMEEVAHAVEKVRCCSDTQPSDAGLLGYGWFNEACGRSL